MRLKKSIFLTLMIMLLWSCEPVEEFTSASNADINGQWSVTQTLTSNTCPNQLGISASYSVVFYEAGGLVYVDGATEPSFFYLNGEIDIYFEIDFFGSVITTSGLITFTDNNNASGTVTISYSSNDISCASEYLYNYSRI
ncbi:MAG: hypothetical protein OEY11_13345 [Gammaproteobacteria bacterium]|nr:hypothetical protein [Gammaproteobacteria bacterium]